MAPALLDADSHRGAMHLASRVGAAMRRRAWCAAVAALLAACGAGHDRGTAPASGSPAGSDTPGEGGGSPGGTPSGGGIPSIEPPPVVARCGGIASLWIAATHTGLVSSFRLGARAAGAPTVVFDLAAGDRFRVGDLALPAAGRVAAYVDLELAHVTGGATSGDVAVCGPPLAFTFDAGDVDAHRCQIVILLDLARSLQRDPATGALLLVPQASLRF
jgi:hypothetical protein